MVPTPFGKVKFYGGYHGDFLVLFLFRACYYGGMIGHNTGRVLFLFLFLLLFQAGSQVIAMRGSYSDDCKWKHVRWSLV
jgi:hypothetical protein